MKKAVSLIELIIAIIIIGIVVSAMPLFISQSTSSNAFLLKQEAILGAKTKLQNILSYPWDGNSYSSTTDMSVVLQTNSSSASLDARKGLSDKRIKVNDKNASYPIGSNTGASIDNFNAQSSSLGQSSISTGLDDAGSLDYIFRNDLSFETKVGYMEDDIAFTPQTISTTFKQTPFSSHSTNIKILKITAKIKEQKDIILYTYVFNVGQASGLKYKEFE